MSQDDASGQLESPPPTGSPPAAAPYLPGLQQDILPKLQSTQTCPEAAPWTGSQILRQGTLPGGRLNIKMSSYQYRDSHVKDRTVSPTLFSLIWESPYRGKMVFILRPPAAAPCLPGLQQDILPKPQSSQTCPEASPWTGPQIQCGAVITWSVL